MRVSSPHRLFRPRLLSRFASWQRAFGVQARSDFEALRAGSPHEFFHGNAVFQVDSEGEEGDMQVEVEKIVIQRNLLRMNKKK